MARAPVNPDHDPEAEALIGSHTSDGQPRPNRPVSDATYNVAADELRQFIERWEHLDSEKKSIADQQKEVMAEAKGRGYDTKIIRKVIAERKRDSSDVAEEYAILDMYRAALGMS